MADEQAPKILIVDDDPLTASWLRALLEQEGYGVLVAQTGSEGLERVRADSPALVLLDVVLPDINGLDLCRRLRQTPEGASARIIMLSIKGSRGDIAAGLDAGADDYIPKRRGADAELLAKTKLMLSRPRIALNPPEESRHGRIVSFFGAKGGSGATTLAVNTAYAISKFPPNASTLLVDMVFPLGAVGHMVGCESTETLANDGEQVPLTTNARVPYLERHGDSVTGVALRELERLTVERSMHPDEVPAAHRP